MFGLGIKKKPEGDVRGFLREVATDIGDAALAQRAVAFLDDRVSFEAWAEEAGHGVAWLDDDYQPREAEVASAILKALLVDDDRAVVLDWADDAEQVLNGVDTLLARAGLAPIDAATRARLMQLCANAKRGDAVPRLIEPLNAEAAARGRVLHWSDTQSDHHLPVLMTEAAHARWRDVVFCKGFRVLA